MVQIFHSSNTYNIKTQTFEKPTVLSQKSNEKLLSIQRKTHKIESHWACQFVYGEFWYTTASLKFIA
jgi:hypothetical protein